VEVVEQVVDQIKMVDQVVQVVVLEMFVMQQ